MTKVLHVINYCGNGGTEKYIISLAKQLHNKKAKFYLAYSIGGPLLKELEDMGVETLQIDMKNIFDLKAAKKLKKFCRKESIKVIHTHFLRENYISVLSKILGNKVKLINTRHMLDNNNFTVRNINKISYFFNFRVIAVSNAVRERLISEGINSNKIATIYNGIDIDYWSSEMNSTIRRELNIKDNQFVLCNVGRFSEEKGQLFLLKSMNHLVENYKVDNIKLLLVGEGSTLERSVLFSERQGLRDYVIFTGYRKDIKNVLKGSNLYIAPSKQEAFGIALIEAMASGLPVIATKIGGHIEILEDKLKGNYLVEYDDYKTMAEYIYNIYSTRDKLSRDNDKDIVDLVNNFSTEKTAKATYSLYK